MRMTNENARVVCRLIVVGGYLSDMADRISKQPNSVDDSCVCRTESVLAVRYDENLGGITHRRTEGNKATSNDFIAV
jgi:hypothetical protein